MGDCLAKHTDRQIDVWNAYFDEQWNIPSRADWYAMQIAAMLSSGKNVSPNDFKMKFKAASDETPICNLTPEQATKMALERRFGAFGVKNLDELKNWESVKNNGR